jgi:hypothetical protein
VHAQRADERVRVGLEIVVEQHENPVASEHVDPSRQVGRVATRVEKLRNVPGGTREVEPGHAVAAHVSPQRDRPVHRVAQHGDDRDAPERLADAVRRLDGVEVRGRHLADEPVGEARVEVARVPAGAAPPVAVEEERLLDLSREVEIAARLEVAVDPGRSRPLRAHDQEPGEGGPERGSKLHGKGFGGDAHEDLLEAGRRSSGISDALPGISVAMA